MFCEQYDEFVKALEKRRFLVHGAANAAEAKKIGLSLIGSGSAGFGGSVTVKELGLYEALQENGNTVYWHWKSEEPGMAQESAASCRLVRLLHERDHAGWPAREH